jgi:tricorn protease-like protein
MAAPFDLKRLEVAGAAVPVTKGIRQNPVNGNAQLSIADEGSLVYISGSGRDTDRTLVWVDRTGREQPLGTPARPYRIPRLSPDGRLLAVSALNDIWIYDFSRATLSRLTFDRASDHPVWSPDGKRIVFQSARDGRPSNLFWKFADGSGQGERLASSDKSQIPNSWSPDGQVISFSINDPSTRLDLWVLPLSEDPFSQEAGTGESRKPHPFLRTPFYESGATFSPDGRWLAYTSNESRQYEIYVQPFAGPGGKWQVSTDRGHEPFWARNGELFYRNGNRMMVVETKTQPTFSASAPRLLFEGTYEESGSANANYSVTSDGQRFVMIKASGSEGGAPTQINVVLNWFEDLKRRVPSTK